MLKEVQFLGEKTNLPSYQIKKIADLTDRNKHNDSVELLAQTLGRKQEQKIMNALQDIHAIERSMHPALIKYRTDIMNRLLKMADRMYGNAKDIHGAF